MRSARGNVTELSPIAGDFTDGALAMIDDRSIYTQSLLRAGQAAWQEITPKSVLFACLSRAKTRRKRDFIASSEWKTARLP
jgi:hypothetical protein